jgi:hypothetical protein
MMNYPGWSIQFRKNDEEWQWREGLTQGLGVNDIDEDGCLVKEHGHEEVWVAMSPY